MLLWLPVVIVKGVGPARRTPLRVKFWATSRNCRWRYSSRTDQFGRNAHSIPAPATQPERFTVEEAGLAVNGSVAAGQATSMQVILAVVEPSPQAHPPVPYTSQLSQA